MPITLDEIKAIKGPERIFAYHAARQERNTEQKDNRKKNGRYVPKRLRTMTENEIVGEPDFDEDIGPTPLYPSDYNDPEPKDVPMEVPEEEKELDELEIEEAINEAKHTDALPTEDMPDENPESDIDNGDYNEHAAETYQELQHTPPSRKTSTIPDIKQEVMADLMALPQTIQQKSTELYHAKQEYEELMIQIKNIRESTLRQVTDEKLDGKKAFSNADAREAETTTRLKNNSNYVVYYTQLMDVKKLIDDMTLALEYYNNKFKSARALAGIIGE